MTYSQNKSNTITIEGTVLDKKTEEPLPFTNVIIEGTSIGTISNEEGKFELVFSKKYLVSNVIFSFIGYQNTKIPVKKFKNPNKIIHLLSVTESLDEIVVKTKNKYKELIDEAITLIPVNYSQETAYLETYYRELTKIDDQYTRFVDAACSIRYSPYDDHFDERQSRINYIRFERSGSAIKKVPYPEAQEMIADEKDQVKIVALRKSDDLRDYKVLEQTDKLKAIDTANLKWLENNEIGGGPLRLTGADKIKRKADFLNPKINHHYKFTKESLSTYNDKVVYIISFVPKDSTNLLAKYQGRITIDQKSKAIVSYRYRLSSLAKKKLKQKFGTQLKTPKSIEKKNKIAFITKTTTLLDYEVVVSYSEYQNKWYLKRIKINNSYANSGDLFDDFTANTESEFIVTGVSKKELPSIIDINPFYSSFTNPLFNYSLKYNPFFWKSYSTIVATGILGKALNDLEAETSLENQFEEN